VARLQRAVLGGAQVATETLTRLGLLRQALDQAGADAASRREIAELEDRLRQLQAEMSGDRTIESRSEPVPPGIQDRVQNIVSGSWSYSGATTGTHRRDYDIAAAAFGAWLPRLRQLVEVDLKRLYDRAEAAGVPWTPGRLPVWSPEP
jgi:hypothetical protein